MAFSKITTNVLQAIYNLFLKWSNPRKRNNHSLYGAPFTTTVTLMDTSKLPKEITTSGRGRNTTITRHLIDKSKLIPVDNNDQYCLLYALILAKTYTKNYIADRKYNENRFSNFHKKQIQHQRKMVHELMTAAGIPKNLKTYDAETYCPMVEKYWQKIYPDTFKIVIFKEYGTYRPVYESEIKHYKHVLIVYHHDNHFDAVRNIYRFFNNCDKYCFSCMVPYEKEKEHILNCNSRCKNCLRVGPGFPCQTKQLITCNSCSKTFNNRECYDHHHAKKYCDNYKKCLLCGVYYNMKDLKRHKQQKHVWNHIM
jgi:hypothetical protein